MVYISKDILPLFKEIIDSSNGNLEIKQLKNSRNNIEFISIQENSGEKNAVWTKRRIAQSFNKEKGEYEFIILEEGETPTEYIEEEESEPLDTAIVEKETVPQ